MFFKCGCVIALAVTMGVLMAANAGATKLAGEFLTTGPGARALGMGGAFVSIADDASASYWNPAGLVQLARRQVLLMHAEQFGNLTDRNCFTFAGPLSEGSASKAAGGISLLWLRVSDIALTSNLNEPGVDFEDLNHDGRWDPATERRLWRADRVRWDSDNELALLVSYARLLSPELAGGVNFKLIWKDVAGLTALGLGIDVGALYHVTDNFRLGVNIQDLTATPLFWDGSYSTPARCADDTSQFCGLETKKVSTTETIYPTVKLGTSLAVPISQIAGVVTLAADCDFKFEGLSGDETDFSFSQISGDVRLGALYAYRGVVHVSLGMDRMKPTAGIGLNVGRFGVDYAFWRDKELDNTHRISATMDF
jgi:hypothetical protein